MNSITSRDRDIIDFVGRYRSITIDQCKKVFMPGCTSGYKIAQRRLNKLVESGYLKVGKTDTNENVYYTEKKLSYHDLLVNSFYAALMQCGAKNTVFSRTQKWLEGKLISDGFFSYDYGQYTFYNILEVCLSRKKLSMDLYEKLYKSGEAHELCKGIFPRLIIMDDAYHREDIYKSSLFPVIQVHYDLSNIPLIFMD